MADIAIGRSCPRDGTLTACSGLYSDSTLYGICAVCNQAVSVANPTYFPATVEPVAEVAAESPMEAVEVAEATNEAEATGALQEPQADA